MKLKKAHTSFFIFLLFPRHLYLPSKRGWEYNIKWILFERHTHFYSFWSDFWCHSWFVTDYLSRVMDSDIISLRGFIEFHSYTHEMKLWHNNSLVMWCILFSFFTHEELPSALRSSDESISTISFLRTLHHSITD